ncbi:uncharacterized protein LOC110825532 isoform X2 [Carica papaya]|uniref:uncharacterized protein LOC110825532 isoform X2 n=1 Tax=Carica papaya TaxID=3649 RepID=UPI000B8D0C78|nr:uncharacterized protein LOC110825532 isoform X2 [Carica papaya]
MVDGKLDLPEDLLSSQTIDEHCSVKDESWEGNGEEKVLMGLADETKDQVNSESSIPLSPQWLYSKSTDAKMLTTGPSGKMRAPNPLPQGNSTDQNLKDSWRLDGAQDKKEWRKSAIDLESSRRWREEERETGLLGRRDRRKEDRRADVSIRDASEGRPLPSSDRWDTNTRSSGIETRRDNKWSTRWGPEDKEKDTRAEKRMDTEKEDAHTEKQLFVTGNRPAADRDTDTRDKWRPRHRMEVNAGGSAPYRPPPGLGLEKGRMEGSSFRFAPGRGRSNSSINGSFQIGRPPTTSAIGFASVDRNGSTFLKFGQPTGLYRYPRGKLLDIYRKQKTSPNFGTVPDMDDISPITQIGAIEPLAFVAPDAEEETVIEDMWKGRIIGRGGSPNLFLDRNSGLSNGTIGYGDMTFTEGEYSSSVDKEEMIEISEMVAKNNSNQVYGGEADAALDQEIVTSWERDTSGYADKDPKCADVAAAKASMLAGLKLYISSSGNEVNLARIMLVNQNLLRTKKLLIWFLNILSLKLVRHLLQKFASRFLKFKFRI